MLRQTGGPLPLARKTAGPVQPSAHRHVLARLVRSQSRAARAARGTIAALGIALGLGSLQHPLRSLLPEYVYRKDFLQEYLLARAVADGTHPYLPIWVLAERYLGALPNAVFYHPTPHPPTVGVLFLPLSALDYPTAAAVWLGLEIACLVAAVWLLGRAAGARMSIPGVLATATALLAWYPVREDLILGQLMLVLLLLVAGARAALLSGRAVVGGVLVGLAVLVKPIPWPLLLLFTLRRDWRALGASLSTIAIGYAVSTWAVGLGPAVAYLREVLPGVAYAYRAHAWNISAWSLGWRMFDGTGSSVLAGIDAPPLARSAPAALVVSAGVPIVVLLLSCLIARKQRDPDASFGVMVCASILVSPISWGHYLVLAAVPAAYAVSWLGRQDLPSREANVALGVAALLVPSFREWAKLAILIAGQSSPPDEMLALPFAPSLLTLAPAIAIGGLGYLVAMLAGRRT